MRPSLACFSARCPWVTDCTLCRLSSFCVPSFPSLALSRREEPPTIFQPSFLSLSLSPHLIPTPHPQVLPPSPTHIPLPRSGLLRFCSAPPPPSSASLKFSLGGPFLPPVLCVLKQPAPMIWLLPTFSEICRLQAEEGVGASRGPLADAPLRYRRNTALEVGRERGPGGRAEPVNLSVPQAVPHLSPLRGLPVSLPFFLLCVPSLVALGQLSASLWSWG